MATVGGAKCLGREDDIGTLGVGKRADIALFDLRDAGYSGAEDPMAALLLCAPQRAHTLVVNGRVVVENGRLTTVSLEPIVTRHRKIASNITGQPALL
jgi:8-oxoguanine deaminase